MGLSKILYQWAKCDGERQAQLQEWLDEAIIQCAQNKGQDVASTSANNVSVAFMSSSLTLVEWMSALSEALSYINNPAKMSRKGIQVFR